MASDILIDYALKNKLINNKNEIYVSINRNLVSNAINITTKGYDKGNYVVINKNNKHTNPSFCATLDFFGINVSKEILYSITPEQDVIMDYSLVKK